MVAAWFRAQTLDGPALRSWGRWERAYSSEVARVEVLRTLHRLRLNGVVTEAQLIVEIGRFEELALRIVWLPILPAVLELAAERFPTHVRTLDAIHLATANIARRSGLRDLVFATHDRQLARAAAALGFTVEGV